jgi:periplasmic divalent cation tolerance protein
MPMAVEPIQVVTTTAEKKDAEKIAAAVLKERLAACVQISGPIESSYWWNGRLETDREYLCTMKTRKDRFPALEAAIKELHPYEIPEIVATPIVAISAEYLAWLKEQTPAKSK